MKKILYNLIGLILGGLIIAACFKQPGYKFVKEMLEGNYKVIKKNPHATIDQRFEAKLGATYRACQYIRQNSPDTAVLLWPDSDDFRLKGINMENKMYGLRFLHPRRLVSKKELQILQNIDEITHVVVISDIEFAVLPMNKNQLSSK